MGGDDFLDDGEAQPGAAIVATAGIVGATEGFEGAGKERLRAMWR